jgi:hypothetical protein
MYSPPSSPLSVGGVIDDGIRLFRSAFSRCWLLAIAPGLILMIYEMAFPFDIPGGGGRTNLFEALRATASPRMLVLDLLSFLLALVFQGAVLVREIAIVRGDDSCTIGRAVAGSLRRLPGMFLGSILFLLAITGGTIALIIPGIWLWGRLQLWTAALFVEDASAIDALGSSWKLTRGNWWRAAVIFTVAVIMVLVLTMVFSFIGGLVVGLGHFSAMSVSGRLILAQLFSLVSSAIYYPLGVAIWLAMYNDMKLRREGGDLDSRARALGTA